MAMSQVDADYEYAMALAGESEPGASCSIPQKSAKRPNWTELEKKLLVDEVHAREGRLFGKFKGGAGGKAAKDKAWTEVAGAVNGYVSQ